MQSEHKAVPLTSAQPAVTHVAKTTPEISAHQRPTLGTAERTTPAHSPVADIGVINRGNSARRVVEIGYGLVAPAIDARPAAQRITVNRSLDASFWQFATAAETAISELAPRRKSMSQAIDTLRQRIASVIDVLR